MIIMRHIAEGLPSRRLKYLMIAVVAIFAIHTLEESIGIDDWANANPSGEMADLYRTVPFTVSATILWLVFTVVTVFTIKEGRKPAWALFLLSLSALTASTLVQTISATGSGARIPGFYSGSFLLLPVCIATVFLCVYSKRVSLEIMVTIFILGTFLLGALLPSFLYLVNMVYEAT